MDIFELSPREFRAFLEEERQYRTPEQIDDLMRRYNQANSLSGRLSGLLAPQEGRRRATFFPASVPEGMSLFDAVRSGEADFAVPQGIVDMVVGGVQGVENPGLAAQGRIPAADMNAAGFETAAAAMGLSGLFAGRGGFTPDPTTTRIFAGPKAKTADLDALKVAKELSARRRDPDEIFRETGWFKGADNQWRFEIPDDKVEFIPGANLQPEYQLKRAAGLGDVIKHDELFAAYPELRGVLTQTGDNPTPYGGWQPYQDRSSEGFVDIEEEMRAYGPTRRDVESVLLHEIDHAVANREGFSGGTNQSEATNRILEQQNIDLYNLEQRMEKRTEELGLSPFDYRPDTTDPELLQLRSEYDAKLGRSPSNQDIFAMYQRNMGEVAARNTESRRDMTAAERRETPPRLTEDTPREAQWTEGLVSANASKGTGAMTLWHGSPYDFNEFDLSKIGTGEGAQDLGRGFSLTDYEANAHLYTNPASRWGDLAAMERYRQAGPGRYYQVNVGAAPEQFLDWNKPWRDQVPEATPLYDALAKEEAVMLSQYADDPAMQAAIPRGKVSNMWRDNAGLEDAALQSGFVGNSRRNYSGDTEYTVFDPSLLRIDQKFDADGNVVSANASKSAGLLSVASDVSARGDQILNMLKSGRGSEVTDAMLDMGDSVKNTQLNQYLAANYDLPMDEASRLARAREMGLLDTAYHSTGRDFQNFVPSEFRGASFFAATPEGASKGASASANEGVGSGSKITMPVRVDTSGVEGLGAYARKDMNEFRASLPDRIYTEAEVDALMASDAAPLRGNWSDFFDDLTDYDALRKFRDENPTKEIPDGIVKFRPKRPKSYNKDLKTDLSGRQFAHYSEGMSERPTSEYVKSQGNTGFTMMDESGLALAMVDPTKVRSQFARFDPRLSHLSNVTAANASPISGLLAQSGVSSEQAQRIEDYLYRTGLLQ